MQKKLELEPRQYGFLYPYVCNEGVSDIDFNQQEVYITYCTGERRRIKEAPGKDFMTGFSQLIADMEQVNFNRVNPVVEAETKNLRISVFHESISMGGRSISIRKSLPKKKFTKEEAIQEGYATAEMFQFLEGCVKAHFNIVVAGEPGVGKTELCKFLASLIDPMERIITIEDNLEWHLKAIHPGADVVELKISREEGEGFFSYRDAIKASLRHHPKWLMLSEARGEEARALMEAWSTGISGMTTIHTDDVAKIPERIINMVGDYRDAKTLQHQIYHDIDVGVLLVFARNEEKKLIRRVEQICIYDQQEDENYTYYLVDRGKMTGEAMPEVIKEKLEKKGIKC